jgi:signal transduction histidine kinase
MLRASTQSRLWRFAPTAAAVTAILLVVTGIIIVYSGESAYQQQKAEEFRAEADILASTVVAAVTFDDRKAAETYVRALRVNPAIDAAAVYDASGGVFAGYRRSSDVALPVQAPSVVAAVQAGHIAVTTPITHGHKLLGTVYVRGTIDQLIHRYQRYSVVGLLIAMAALVTTALGVAQASLTHTNRELSEANANLGSEIAQREIAEEALRQAQKMEAIGQLTGGVAHDFNNILQVILGNLGLVEQQLAGREGGDARTVRSVQAAIRAGDRAASLTRQLLAFSRRQPLNPKLIEPNRLIGGMSNLLHRTLGETIEIETVLGARPWPIHADGNQLESAILNLAVNARDAMPDGGKLTIETSNAYLDEAYAASERDVEAGQYVAIAVSDTGTGMPREVIEKAFDPFFTTKEVGHGTGLGLSQVYGFIKQSGGHVKIYSEIGEGTTVKLYLPRAAGDNEATEHPTARVPLPRGDREVILVVEDEADVRAFVTDVLQALGYTVIAAGDAASALGLLETHPHLDLLFTDVGLPGGVNGRRLAEELSQRYPGLKILYTTGYARNAIVHQGRLDPDVQLINKPFTYTALAARVREVLDAA